MLMASAFFLGVGGGSSWCYISSEVSAKEEVVAMVSMVWENIGTAVSSF